VVSFVLRAMASASIWLVLPTIVSGTAKVAPAGADVGEPDTPKAAVEFGVGLVLPTIVSGTAKGAPAGADFGEPGTPRAAVEFGVVVVEGPDTAKATSAGSGNVTNSVLWMALDRCLKAYLA